MLLCVALRPDGQRDAGGPGLAAVPALAKRELAELEQSASAGGGGKGVKLGATDFGAGSLASALVDSDDEEEESEPLGGGAGEHCSPLDGSLGGSGRGGGIPEKGPVSIVSMVSAVDASCRAFQAKLESAPLLPCALCGELVTYDCGVANLELHFCAEVLLLHRKVRNPGQSSVHFMRPLVQLREEDSLVVNGERRERQRSVPIISIDDRRIHDRGTSTGRHQNSGYSG